MSEPIAVVLAGRAPNREHPVLFAVETGKPTADQLREFMPRYFSDEKIREVGVGVLAAWVAGGPERELIARFKKILIDATKGKEHLFVQGRDATLVRQAFAYMIESCQIKGQNGIWKNGKFNEGTFKENVEALFNNRMTIAKRRWQRIRNTIGLPKQATGAAASNYRRKQKTRRGSTKF